MKSKCKSKFKGKKVVKLRTPAVRVVGKVDSITDLLKQILYQKPQQKTPELMQQLQRWLGSMNTQRLEKNVDRCLQHNPCFRVGADEAWSLDLRGQRENDSVYQMLLTVSQPANIRDVNAWITENGGQPSVMEKDMVWDGRFIRLTGGKWGLVHWEVVRKVTTVDLQKVTRMLRLARGPVTLEELSRQVLEGGSEGSDLRQRMIEDGRFVWVGGEKWWLKEMMPEFVLPSLEFDPVAPFRQTETEALQEAELVLILNDADPSSRSYVLSTLDLESGSIRIGKRLEKLFAGFPAISLVSLQTDKGYLEAWYDREQGRIFGLGEWFVRQGLVAGSILALRKTMEDNSAMYSLEATGERVAEVYAEAQRVLQLEKLHYHSADLSYEELLARILQLFPEGLMEEKLTEALATYRPGEQDELSEVLHSRPFFEEMNQGTWRFNPDLKKAYDQLHGEIRAVQELLEQAQGEAASAMEDPWNNGDEEEEDLRHRVSRLIAQNARAQRDNARIRDELARAAEREEQNRLHEHEQEAEIKSLRSENDSLRNRVDNFQWRIVQLQGSLTQAMKEAQEEQASLKQKLKEKEYQLEKSIFANQGLQMTVDQLQRERNALKRRLAPWLVRAAVWITWLFGRDPGLKRDRTHSVG
ncbi:MAG: hypothetical protein ACYCX4_07395 [Bacillota bacterium]